MNCDLRELRLRIERMVKVGPTPIECGKRPLSPEVGKVIRLAIEIAELLKTEWVGTEHLLLGMVGIDGGKAKECLAAFNVDYDRTMLAVKQFLDQTTADTAEMPTKAFDYDKLRSILQAWRDNQRGLEATANELRAFFQ
jgi:ATP-dependent Clp protease ATP-binding subunit ClpA